MTSWSLPSLVAMGALMGLMASAVTGCLSSGSRCKCGPPRNVKSGTFDVVSHGELRANVPHDGYLYLREDIIVFPSLAGASVSISTEDDLLVLTYMDKAAQEVRVTMEGYIPWWAGGGGAGGGGP